MKVIAVFHKINSPILPHSDVANTYYRYDIRHNDNAFSDPETIEEWVGVNYHSSIYLDKPLDFKGKDYINIKDFEKEYNIDLIKLLEQ